MTEKPFTNRELKLMFEQINQKLDTIHEQTQKTNGRTTTAEKKINDLEKEHVTAKAYAVAVSVFIGAIVTIANFVSRII